MQKWEYQVISIKRKRKETFSSLTYEWETGIDLGKMGEEGWELVSVLPIANLDKIVGITHELQYFFKRPK